MLRSIKWKEILLLHSKKNTITDSLSVPDVVCNFLLLDMKKLFTKFLSLFFSLCVIGITCSRASSPVKNCGISTVLPNRYDVYGTFHFYSICIMKQLVPFLLAGMLACPVLAQHQQYSALQPEFIVSPSALQYHSQNVALPTESTLDTLDQYLKRSTGLTVYPYAVQGDAGVINLPITGTNNAYAFLGNTYDFSGTATVRSVLVLYNSKLIQGTPDTFTAAVFSVNDHGLPIAQLGMQQFSTDIIDTNSAQPVFTAIDFETPVPVSSSFAVMVQTIDASQGADLDFVFIYSNQQGDGRGENRACAIGTNDQGQPFSTHLANIFSGDAGSIDIDPIIIPVLETSTTGVDDYITLNGLTLKGAFPSPASNNTSIQFAIDKPASVEINIIDMTGRVVSTVRQNAMEAGNHALDLDLRTLPTGSYMYTVSTGTAHVAGKLTVTK